MFDYLQQLSDKQQTTKTGGLLHHGRLDAKDKFQMVIEFSLNREVMESQQFKNTRRPRCLVTDVAD